MCPHPPTIFTVCSRSALTACGWAGKFDLVNVLAECEALGEYERSAAVAVWHGDIGAAVETLQRASDGIRLRLGEQDGTAMASLSLVTAQYAETLDLIAMCIAGYGGTSTSSSRVWRSACTSLLRREDLSEERGKSSSRIAYLRGLCHFLMSIGLNDGMDHVLGNDQLSLCDRVAFACRFLAPSDLVAYLTKCIKRCRDFGDIEGLVITGLSKEGIAIVQAFVDRYADVQTAALVVSRAILPSDWTNERRVCTEWVEAYRGLLNTWQMWQSRAMFDVDRAELLRRIKVKSTLDVLPGAGSKSRRLPLPGRRQNSRVADPDVLASVPAQLDARCNYCSSPLGLRRNEMNSNQWLSKMKPVLSCCPQCRKPLPRCSICLLSLGCLNPYMELTRDRSRPGPRGASSPMQSTDDLSSLANLPFAEWFTWCMRCNHGGHAHHLVGWFSNHQEVCPVSGCDCKCQFDGVIKLSRPALCKPAIGEYI
jgi:WD repeat-containing protein mio